MMRILFLSMLFIGQIAQANVPNEAYTFEFNVKKINMSRYKEDRIEKAIDLLRRVFASAEFKRRILNHRYRGRRTYIQNRGLSNYQIYKKILAGAETLRPHRNNAMDLEVALYTNHQSVVIGHTHPSSKRIWLNTKYFNRFTTAQIAANLVHEWLHKVGFSHDYHRSERRKYSVPYAIGYIVKDMTNRPWKY